MKLSGERGGRGVMADEAENSLSLSLNPSMECSTASRGLTREEVDSDADFGVGMEYVGVWRRYYGISMVQEEGYLDITSKSPQIKTEQEWLPLRLVLVVNIPQAQRKEEKNDNSENFRERI